MGILIFKWLTARRLYKSFGVKGLNNSFDIYDGVYIIWNNNDFKYFA
jgi:hypothetical protein